MNTGRNPTTFHALNLSITLARTLRPVAVGLEKHDRDLVKQLRRAASSVALNLSEGRKRPGRDRLHLGRIASGSADETRICVHLAEAWGYVEAEEISESLQLLDQILAICWRLTER